MEMFTSYIFWLSTFLFPWGVLCYSASTNFNGANLKVKSFMSAIGGLGVLFGIIRFITIGIHFGVIWAIVSFTIACFIGISLMMLIQPKTINLIGIIGIFGIPIIWWIGGIF